MTGLVAVLGAFYTEAHVEPPYHVYFVMVVLVAITGVWAAKGGQEWRARESPVARSPPPPGSTERTLDLTLLYGSPSSCRSRAPTSAPPALVAVPVATVPEAERSFARIPRASPCVAASMPSSLSSSPSARSSSSLNDA